MINKKILGLIGLATKAGKICFGADSVELRIKRKKVHLVIIAQDASDRTKEKFKKMCEEYGVLMIVEGTIEILSKAIGKSNKAIIGLEDENLVNEIQKINSGGEFIG